VVVPAFTIPANLVRGVVLAPLVAVAAGPAWPAYPIAAEIADRYAPGTIAIRLTDAFVAPKSGTGSGATSAQVARVNFLRSEPVAALAAERIFVNDMNGRLSMIDRATGSFSTYLDFDAVFTGVGTGDFDADPGYAAGLVTMEFDPAYATNGKFYTVHTELGPGSATDYRQAVLSEWHDTNIADAVFTGTRAELLRVDYVNRVHPLGDISFNPAATDPTDPDWRMMYIASGDGGSGESGGAARSNPQRLDSLVGKILRIQPTETGTGGGYSIPADNPFATTAGAHPAVFATGLRNPHRLSWDVDEAGVARGLIADIGLHAYEEVNLLAAGANYGYSRIEGDQVLGSDNRVSAEPLPATLPLLGAGGVTLGASVPTYPVAFYSHLDGDAIAGGFVYRGRTIPALQGKYVFGDITNGRLFYADLAEMLAADDGNPATAATIHELDVYYDDPTTPAGVESRRVFDIVRDRWDLRNETATGSVDLTGIADGDRLPGGAATTNGSDPYGVAYGGGRADIRLAVIDDELYLLSKTDGMVRAIGAAHLVLDVAAGTATQAEAGYAALDWGLSLTKSGAGSVVLDAANGFTGPVIVTGGTLVVTRDGVLTPTSLAIAAGARLALPATERVGLAVTSLDLAAGGRLDLGGGVITIAAGGISATDLQAALRAGRAGGSWTGHDGIGSTATAGDREVGYLIAADGSATISYAAAGDIDLNGTVNVFDLVGVNAAGSYGTGRPSAWQTGDFDYDGATNVFDLVRVNTAGAYGRGEYLPPRSPAPAPVPEPGVGLPLIGCLLPLLGGRPLTSLSLRPIAGDRRCN
jgi:autotransporter-associated beta strand protein